MPAAAWKALQKDAQLFPTALIKPGCQLSVCVYVASQLRLLRGKSYAVNTAKEEQGIAWRVPKEGRGLKALEEVGLVLVSGFAALGLRSCGQERRAAGLQPTRDLPINGNERFTISETAIILGNAARWLIVPRGINSYVKSTYFMTSNQKGF